MAKLEGADELRRQLKRLEKEMQAKALRSAVRAAAQPIVRAAKVKVPKGSAAHLTYKKRLVAPGFASRNIRAITVAKGSKVAALVGVRKEAFYSTQFVERGTVRQSPRPWLEPAFETTKAEQQKRFAAQLRRAIDRAARKGP